MTFQLVGLCLRFVGFLIELEYLSFFFFVEVELVMIDLAWLLGRLVGGKRCHWLVNTRRTSASPPEPNLHPIELQRLMVVRSWIWEQREKSKRRVL